MMDSLATGAADAAMGTKLMQHLLPPSQTATFTSDLCNEFRLLSALQAQVQQKKRFMLLFVYDHHAAKWSGFKSGLACSSSDTLKRYSAATAKVSYHGLKYLRLIILMENLEFKSFSKPSDNL